MDEQRQEARTELREELRLLGQRLREAFIAARESQEAQEFQQELGRGVKELREEIEELLGSEEAQRLQESARSAVQEVSQGDVGQQVRKGVLAALKELNTRLGQVIKEAEQGESTEETPPAESSS